MLGLKKITRLQLDCWCGDSNDFDCHAQTKSVDEGLILLKKYRHIGIKVDEVNLSQINALIQKLEATEHPSKKRLSFICQNLEDYKKVQDILNYIAT